MLGAAFSGFAVVSIIAISLRSCSACENLVTDDHLDLLGKVLLATGLMTAYGYVFEVFDALYSGDAHELQTLADRMTGAYAWTYWGAIIFNFIPLQALWWRSRAAHRLDADADLDLGRDRHVARALYDPRHQPLSRFPGVVVGRLHADLLGLVDLFRHHRAFPGAVPARHPVHPDDFDLRDRRSSSTKRRRRSMAERAVMACWPSSTARRR